MTLPPMKIQASQRLEGYKQLVQAAETRLVRSMPIMAVTRLQATELTELGSRLYKEMSMYLRGLKLSRVDGTILVPPGLRPAQHVLKALGFTPMSGTRFYRPDMTVEVSRPSTMYDYSIHIIPT